mmetsp:Transcript_21205/g.42316  ORF Transcript_21205/g.42316 Transcript_21205/m.42316 type:complete len:315 (+) Transcript_21205:34-978(+)
MPSTVVPTHQPPVGRMVTSVRKGPMLTIHPETLRCCGYLCFWLMVALAMVVTKVAVDVPEETALMRVFGYNNICMYWDYSPAREIAAMFYPAVEFCLLGYLLASHLHVWSSWSQRLVSHRFLVIDRFLVVIEIVLMSWFRMCFVIQATVDTMPGHTMGFLGLQVVLVIVAIKNLVYFHKLHKSPVAVMQDSIGCHGLLSEKGQDIVGGFYVFLLVGATLFKISFSVSTFKGDAIVDAKEKGSQGQKIAQLADVIWMLLAAVIPFIIAVFQRKHTDTLHIALGFDDSKVLGNKDENEEEGLLVEGGGETTQGEGA